MSMEDKQVIKCPKCEQDGDFTVWHTLNVQLNPEMKESVLNGNIFKYKCNHCGKSFFVQYDFLYHDMKKNFMVYFSADEESQKAIKEEWGKLNSDDDSDVLASMMRKMGADYKHRIVSDINSLSEKIRIFDCGLDDRIVEIIKIFTIANVKEQNANIEPEGALFCSSDNGEKALGIVVDGDIKSFCSFDMNAYENMKKNWLSKIENASKGEFIIDFAWAFAFIQSVTNK